VPGQRDAIRTVHELHWLFLHQGVSSLYMINRVDEAMRISRLVYNRPGGPGLRLGSPRWTGWMGGVPRNRLCFLIASTAAACRGTKNARRATRWAAIGARYSLCSSRFIWSRRQPGLKVGFEGSFQGRG